MLMTNGGKQIYYRLKYWLVQLSHGLNSVNEWYVLDRRGMLKGLLFTNYKQLDIEW